jgi:hypothetical protein
MMGRMEDWRNPILAAGGYFEKSKVEGRKPKVDQLEMGGADYGNPSRENLLPFAFNISVLSSATFLLKTRISFVISNIPALLRAVGKRPFVFIHIPGLFAHF